MKAFKVMEASTGEIRKTVQLPIESGKVLLSNNARRALLIPTSQSGDHPAIVFDPLSSKEVRRISRVHGISDGTISDDGNHVVCGGFHLDHYNLQTGKMHEGRAGQRGYFWGLAISPDNKYLATGSGSFYDGKQNNLGNRLVRLWDLDTGQEIASHQKHNAWVTSVKFLTNRNALLSAGGGTPEYFQGRGPDPDNALRLWDLNTREVVWTADGHTAAVTCLAVTPDGRLTLSGSYDNTVMVWRLPE
jgi:WD40 repeat protein